MATIAAWALVLTAQAGAPGGRLKRCATPSSLRAEPTMDDAQLLRELNERIPYRMKATAILNCALELRSRWQEAPAMALYVDGKQIMEGNLNAFTNPAIEAGLVHCRALLEFLGLRNKKGTLCNIEKRVQSDIGIEHFKSADGYLKMLDAETALENYDGERAEAKKALLTVFHIANKGVAHITQALEEHPEHATLVEIASRGIPSLMVSYLYTPLGIPAPKYQIIALAAHAGNPADI
jgi:hypothetical protein